jgi:hypothetical protein
MSRTSLARSRALWNRSHLDLRSDEVLAQILDRGSLADWRELYALAREDPALRTRILRTIERVPLPLPRFWQAAMARLGEEVDFDRALPGYGPET